MSGPTFDVSGAGLIPREVTATEDFGQFSPQFTPDFAELIDGRHVIRRVAG